MIPYKPAFLYLSTLFSYGILLDIELIPIASTDSYSENNLLPFVSIAL